jgi:hypothetical protein
VLQELLVLEASQGVLQYQFLQVNRLLVLQVLLLVLPPLVQVVEEVVLLLQLELLIL